MSLLSDKSRFFLNVGEVDRYCDETRRDPGCLTTSDLTVCACHYKDKCNGPVGDEAAEEGKLSSSMHKNQGPFTSVSTTRETSKRTRQLN